MKEYSFTLGTKTIPETFSEIKSYCEANNINLKLVVIHEDKTNNVLIVKIYFETAEDENKFGLYG
ncbi:MAG: hypothetical protein QXX78_07360 [Nitrososphaerota archaeon]